MAKKQPTMLSKAVVMQPTRERTMRENHRERLAGSVVPDTGRRVLQAPAGRRCADCGMPLSRYNPDFVCQPCQLKARQT